MVTHLSDTMQDYLETIFSLQRSERVVRVKEIAKAMNVKMPSVTSALRTLSAEKLVRHEKYGHVELTPEGRELAESIHRRHITLVGFLRDILQLDEKTADEGACRLEHGLSRETLRRLLGLMEFIEGCPRSGGDWLKHMRGRWEHLDCDHDCRQCVEGIQIPDSGPFAAPEMPDTPMTLDKQEPGFKGTIVRVAGKGPLRRRLMEMGVTAGTPVELERLAPLGDPLEIKLRGYHLSLRKEEAANVFVDAN